jgi:4-hydroxybenzoate polyprenyltransferase
MAEVRVGTVALRPRAGSPRLHLARALLVAMRPAQWQKNLLLYAAFVFTAGSVWSWRASEEWAPLLLMATAAFWLFNAVASGAYLLNDVVDAERDRAHPRKRLRPVAAGRLSSRAALRVAAALILGSVVLAVWLEPRCAVVLLAYVGLTSAYSLWLKHIVVLDVIAVAAGFALRAMAGAVVIDVPVSPWLCVVTGLGALLLVLVKRRQELEVLPRGAGVPRRAPRDYTPRVLELLVWAAMAATIVAYALYVTAAENTPDDYSMLLTAPFVVFGLFRFRRVAERHPTRNVDEVIVRDPPLLASVALFAATAFVILALHG